MTRASGRDLFAALRQVLAAAAAAGVGAGTADGRRFAALVGSLDLPRDPTGPAPPDARAPVCRFWEPALDGADAGPAAGLVPGLRALGPRLRWRQNPDYHRRPPDPTFLDNYGYAVIAGPPGGEPPLLVHRRLALGVLLLGPGTQYPLHHHPAVEPISS